VVVADAPVLAGIRRALVDVDLALFAAVAGQAVADELVDAVLAATPELARVRIALVHVAEAAGVVVAPGALATETVDHVDADAAVGARVRSAFIDVVLAVFAGVAGEAFAVVAARKWTSQKNALNAFTTCEESLSATRKIPTSRFIQMSSTGR
jgi:hypothetical protein